MTTDDASRRCISKMELRTLAIRLFKSTGAAAARGVSPPESLPEDYFASGEDASRDHVSLCLLCREALLEELRFLGDYTAALESPEVEAAIRSIVAEACRDPAIVLRARSTQYAVEHEHELAARTRNDAPGPRSFSSDDGAVVLRGFESETGGRTEYFLSGDPGFARNTVLRLGSRAFIADGTGRVDFRGKEHLLDSAEEIVVYGSENR